MNELFNKKLNTILKLEKPKKSISTWNINELCSKIHVDSKENTDEIMFDFTYLYNYLGLKVVNEDINKKEILNESYELLKVSYYSGQYNGQLQKLKMLAQLVASGVICSKIAEVRMLLNEELLDTGRLKLFENDIDKLYALTIMIYLLSVRKLNAWNDIDEIEVLHDKINEISSQITPKSKYDIYLITACFNIDEAVGDYKKYLLTGTPANIEKIIMRKIFVARDIFNEINMSEDALLALLILHSLKEMISNSLWSTIDGISEKIDEYLKMFLMRENKKPIFDLWPSQKTAIKNNLFDLNKSALVVQMPTSAGKSLLAKLYIMQIKSVYSEAKIAYLVPTRALVNQVKRDLKSEFSIFGYKVDVAIPFMDIDEIEEELLLKNSDIIVTTPEKFDIMQRSKHPFVDKLRLVIVDEAHNIQDSGRGAKLELLLAMLRKNDRNLKILMLSPFMKNANEVASWLSGDRGIDIFVDWKPAQQFTGISENVPIQPRGSIQTVKYIPCACNDVYSDEFNINIVKLSKKVKNKIEQAYILAEKYKQLGGVLVLCTQQKYAENFTKLYLSQEDLPEEELKKMHSLFENVEIEMGADSLLYKVLKKGCAYHHSALPLNIREEIEDVIRIGAIKVVAATTTLAQGMNFPIATVIFQGMSIPQGKYGRPMSTSEFWNIAGRAGRALVDKEGHVISICNNKEQEEQYRDYLKKRNEEVLSSLLSVLKEIPDDCLSTYYIKQYSELSAFLQYIYHVMKIYSDIELEDLLRGSYVYSNLENEGDNKLAEKLLRITKSYIDKISSDLGRKKLMDIIDKTGISSISMKRLMVSIRRDKYIVPSSEELFDNKNGQLCKVIEIANSIPEINLGIYDADSPLNLARVATITELWVKGRSIRTIAESCFKEKDNDIQTSMNICGKYIYSKLINNLPWGISTIYKAQGVVYSGEEKSVIDTSLIPSYIYFGVNNPVSVALCMLGVSRYASHVLSKEWYSNYEEVNINEYTKIEKWINNLTLDEWRSIFEKYRARNAETNYNNWIKNK